MADGIEGGCQCGATRYRVEGSPVALAVCHCTECQRQSGSAFGMSLIVPKGSFRLVRGEPKKFTRIAESGRPVDCVFCPDCGTRIYHDPAKMPDTLNVKAGTLDDTAGLSPDLHVWTECKQPWVPIPEGARRFDRQP